jgi:hypothetical protein
MVFFLYLFIFFYYDWKPYTKALFTFKFLYSLNFITPPEF